MKLSQSPQLHKKTKKIFRLDFIIFAIVSFVFWIIMLYGINHSVSHHSHFDEYTRQALAWQQGKITLDNNIEYLEIAHYKDKYFVSFPPVPTFIEFPFALFFRLNTPNTFTLLIFTWTGMLFVFFILLKLTKNRILSYLMSFSFYWGSTVLYLSLEGAVWHQGQLYGLFFAVTALLILLYAQKPFFLFFGALSLALSVGCRPFYLIMTPFYGFHAFRRFPYIKTLAFVITGLMPPGIFYAVYNYVRFGSIFEIGHKYIPWSNSLPHGIFSLTYFKRNIYHAFAHPPEWDKAKNILSFNGAGTGLWFSSPVLLLGFSFFLRYMFVGIMKLVIQLKNKNLIKKILGKFRHMAEEKVPVAELVLSFLTIAVIWFVLLLHESNGWYQFGYRYSVDLIPLLVFFFGRTFKKPHIFLVPICQFAVIINIYGALWFYLLRL